MLTKRIDKKNLMAIAQEFYELYQQILVVTSHKKAVVRPPTTHLEKSDVLQWTPSYRRPSVGLPARTYLQQLCTDTGCGLKDLPETMDYRDEWRKRVREIRASGTSWWWWWWEIMKIYAYKYVDNDIYMCLYIYIYIYIEREGGNYTQPYTREDTQRY